MCMGYTYKIFTNLDIVSEIHVQYKSEKKMRKKYNMFKEDRLIEKIYV